MKTYDTSGVAPGFPRMLEWYLPTHTLSISRSIVAKITQNCNPSCIARQSPCYL